MSQVEGCTGKVTIRRGGFKTSEETMADRMNVLVNTNNPGMLVFDMGRDEGGFWYVSELECGHFYDKIHGESSSPCLRERLRLLNIVSTEALQKLDSNCQVLKHTL